MSPKASKAAKKAAKKPASKAAKKSAGVKATRTSGGHQLRVAHVWLDEVMADRLIPGGKTVTLGKTQRGTFTVPDLGIPDDFAIIRPGGGPGGRGHVLTLGDDMGGRLSLGGDEIDASELAHKGEKVGDFHATPIGPGDWGVVELDSIGDHKLFFQFVRDDPPLPTSTWRDSGLMLPAIAFALILHTVFIAVSFQLAEDGNSLVFPGRRDLMARYLVEPPPPPVENQEGAASSDGDKEAVNSATKGDEGKDGGEERDVPEEMAPDVVDVAPEAPAAGVLTKANRRTMNKAISFSAADDKVLDALASMGPRTTPDFSKGAGSGGGIGDRQGGSGTRGGSERSGSGGGGSADKRFRSQGKINAGEKRAPKGSAKDGAGRARKEVAVLKRGSVSGDLGGRTKAEIDKVMRQRQGLFRACYQSELNRVRGLGGKVVMQFRIRATGQVASSRVVGSKSSLRNPRIESCINRHITRLKFPPKAGNTALVEYPLFFSSQG